MKYRHIAYTFLLALTSTLTQAQVKIGNNPTTITPGALLDIEGSTNAIRTVSLPNGNLGIMTNSPTHTVDVNGNAGIRNNNFLEFGHTVTGKEANAGKMGYQTFTPGALDIVGAGESIGTRNIKLWDKVKIGGGGTPITTLDIEGNARIADGTQGDGKVLTSDANGVASWQALANKRIPETVFVGIQTSDYTVTEFVNQYDVKDRIPMTVSGVSLPGYNPSTKQYTIQSDGFYRVTGGTYMTGTIAPSGATPLHTRGTVYINPFGVLDYFDDMSTNVGPVLSIFWESYLTAGSTVDLTVTSRANYGNGGAAPQFLITRYGFLTITKLF